MGGKTIVKRKTWRLHGMLYIFISQDKVEQQRQKIVYCFRSFFAAGCTDICDHKVRGPETPGGQKGNTGTLRTPDTLLHPFHLQSADLLSFSVVLSRSSLLFFFSLHCFTSPTVQPELCLLACLEEYNGCFLEASCPELSPWPPLTSFCFTGSAGPVSQARLSYFHLSLLDLHCCESNCVPPKDTLKSYPLVPLNATLSGNRIFVGIIQWKMRSYWIRAGFIPSDWCPDKQATWWQRQRLEWGMQVKESKIRWQLRAAGREPRNWFSLRASRRNQPRQHLNFSLLTSETMRGYISVVFKPPSLRLFVTTALGN